MAIGAQWVGRAVLSTSMTSEQELSMGFRLVPSNRRFLVSSNLFHDSVHVVPEHMSGGPIETDVLPEHVSLSLDLIRLPPERTPSTSGTDESVQE